MELDKDLAARQEARALCRAAEEAQKKLSGFSQEKLDGMAFEGKIKDAITAARSEASASNFSERRISPSSFPFISMQTSERSCPGPHRIFRRCV